MLYAVILAFVSSVGQPSVVVEAYKSEADCQDAMVSLLHSMKAAQIIPNKPIDLNSSVYRFSNAWRLECMPRT